MSIIQFSGRAADWLQQQYNFYTDWNNMLPAVQASSSQPYVDSVMLAKSSCDTNSLMDRCVWNVCCSGT